MKRLVSIVSGRLFQSTANNIIKIITFAILLSPVLAGLNCANERTQLPIIKKGVLDLRNFDVKRQGSLPLEGNWEFHWRKLLYPVKSGKKYQSHSPDYLRVPTSWNLESLKGKKIPAHGFGTYKIKVLLNSNSGPLALKIPSIGAAYELYVDGELVTAGGKVGRSKSEMEFRYNPAAVDLPLKKSSSKYKEIEIAFTVSNYHQNFGGIWFVPLLGSKQAIHSKREFSLVSDFTVFGLLFIMAVYHFILFILRPKETLPLYFAAFCLLISARIPTHNETFILDMLPGIPMAYIIKIQYSTFFLGMPMVVLFYKRAFPGEMHNFLSRPLLLTSLPFIALGIFGGTQLITTALPYYHGITMVGVCFAMYAVIRAMVFKRPGANILLFGTMVLMLTITNDILSTNGWIHTGLTVKYGMLAFILSKSTLLSWRFYKSFEAVENLSGELRDLNQNLERKVDSRTEELQTTLEEVNKLKFQQDADYYLTSLLIKPLAGNHTHSPLVNVDILESQFKQFQFRQKQVEIGGDYSYADNITLQGKQYTLVLNSDAMGKSMQGAGGALILGSVIRSLITRTQENPDQQQLFPEQWLHNCYQELQNVFLTFDGSMLISLILGLIANESGLLYYINAEHPRLVLFRNGRAGFVAEDVQLMKIGNMLPQPPLMIKTFQLQKDDVLLMGSDGRDDIVLGSDQEGKRVINEDENHFLQHVENGQGNLNSIEASILDSGDLMDDFSLLRIGYKEDLSYHEPTRDQLAPAELKSLAKIHTRNGDFGAAALLWEKYTEANPADTRAIYNTSIILRRLGKFTDAANFAERLRLREPNWVRNLLNLAQIYLKLQKTDNAHTICERIKELDPNNQKLLKMQELIINAEERLPALSR